MNVFFDVDFTILSMDNCLRPGTRELFERLVADGHRVYVWSGKGLRHDVIEDHGLVDLVSGVYVKPTYQYRDRLATLGVDVPVDCVVDDMVEVVHAFGGVCVEQYWFGDRADDEFVRVYTAIADRAAANGGPPSSG